MSLTIKLGVIPFIRISNYNNIDYMYESLVCFCIYIILYYDEKFLERSTTHTILNHR